MKKTLLSAAATAVLVVVWLPIAPVTGVRAATAVSVRTGAAASCAAVSGIKPLIRGLVDRAHALPAQDLQAGNILVNWSDLEPSGPGLIPNNLIDKAIAAAGCTPLRLRVQAGIYAPDWVKAASGPPVTVTNGQVGGTGTIGRFWTSTFQLDYDRLQAELAAAYDSVPNLDEVVVSRCTLFYMEPLIRFAYVAGNVTNLRAAGYSETADQLCQQQEIDSAASHWTTTRFSVTFNPYQAIASDGLVSVDETYTEQLMGYCRLVGGPRCVLENDSIRDPIGTLLPQPEYSDMYNRMSGVSGPIYVPIGGLNRSVTLGAPLAFQTAAMVPINRIGDFWGTLVWARQHHAASVELPAGYPTSGVSGAPAWQTIAEVALWFQDDPVITATPLATQEGQATTGMPLASLTLGELAAFDTVGGYLDVGAVPFDTVSALVGWLDGSAEAAMLTTGSSGPAASVTCPQQRSCTVTIESGGHTAADEAKAAPAAVSVSLIAGQAYVPADGVSIVANPMISVSDNGFGPANPNAFNALAGIPFSGVIGTFQDGNRLASPNDTGGSNEYSVTINWGDASVSDVSNQAVTVQTPCGPTSGTGAGQGCIVAINGSHMYSAVGTYNVSGTFYDGANPTAQAFTSTATVTGNKNGNCTTATTTLTPANPTLPTGATQVFTAASTACTNPQFQFWLQYPAGTGSWTIVQPFSNGSATWSWNTTNAKPGAYRVVVWANQTGHSQSTFEAYGSTSPTLTGCGVVTVTWNPNSPQPSGTNAITLTGNTSGCAAPQFEFWVLAPGASTWVDAQAYSATSTLSWNTTNMVHGTYNFSVWAKEATSGGASGNSLGRWDNYAATTYMLTSVICTSMSVTSTPPNTAPAGTNPVTLKGFANPCTFPLYQFWVLAPGSTMWVDLQPYSNSPTFNWNTTLAAKGVYHFSVWLKDSGSPGKYGNTLGRWDVYEAVTYTLT